jgi:hypothetical protein
MKRRNNKMTVRELIQALLLTANLDDEVYLQNQKTDEEVYFCAAEDRNGKETVYIYTA